MVSSAPSSNVSQLTDSFFRHEAGKLIALLVKSFGPDHIQLAEDVVQEALAKALKTWPYLGVPENPGGWITQTAKNLALDALRRDRVLKQKHVQMFGSVHRWSAQMNEADLDNFGEEVEDAILRFMFVCSHPEIPENSRHVLALKSLCGFSVPEISHALLTSDAAISKRLTRAKDRLAEGDISTSLPVGEALEERLDGVLKTLYLLFNEGYKASTGDTLIKEDLCAEAIRLTSILIRLPVGDRPRVYALLSLMLFNAARLQSRVDDKGNLLLLKDQDRSAWNHDLIHQGLRYMTRSASGDTLNSFHLQAAISAIHCIAPTYEQTDWQAILTLYDHMVTIDSSPIVGLNRAVVVAQIQGPQKALDAINQIAGRSQLETYYLYFAVLADFHGQQQQWQKAREAIQKAISLATSVSEKSFLEGKLRQYQAHL